MDALITWFLLAGPPRMVSKIRQENLELNIVTIGHVPYLQSATLLKNQILIKYH